MCGPVVVSKIGPVESRRKKGLRQAPAPKNEVARCQLFHVKQLG